MPPRSGATSLAQIREAVILAARSSSVRRVASEIGLSPAGLQKLINGSEPHAATRRKLEDWYVRWLAAGGRESGADAAEMALYVLMRDLPQLEREEVKREVIQALADGFKRARLRPPRWFQSASDAPSPAPIE
jgi:hypothetical protein